MTSRRWRRPCSLTACCSPSRSPATAGATPERESGPGRLEESEPYPLRIRLRGALLPPPGGELADPLLDRSVPVGPSWARHLEREIWLEGPGRLPMPPARLEVRD